MPKKRAFVPLLLALLLVLALAGSIAITTEPVRASPDYVVVLSNPTEDGHVTKHGTSYVRDDDYCLLEMGSTLSGYIQRAYVEWDISSIPDEATITRVSFEYQGNKHEVDAHIHEMMGTRPSTSSHQAVYDEAGGGTSYANPSGFPSVGTYKIVDLGSSAESDLEYMLTHGDWFAIGIQADYITAGVWSEICSEEWSGAAPKPTLYVEYIIPSPDLPAPTGVSASDGTYTDRVHITWDKVDGATEYQVYRSGVGLGWLGDVSSFDDYNAGAPYITAGYSIASDGTYTDKVRLSLSGTNVHNGTSYSYTVKARDSTRTSPASGSNSGYRGHGSLTYQWQRSAGDSDGSYSNIYGATSTTHYDYNAPADGSGRYYRCKLNADGATQQYSASDRGYRLLIREWQEVETWTDYVEVPNTAPTTPTTLTLTPTTIYVGTKLTAGAYGSIDIDGDPITYYYKFYNQTDAKTRQNWSTTNTYVIQQIDAHDTMRVYAKAYDGTVYSGEKTTTKTVTNTAPTTPAALTLSPATIYVGNTLTATASGSSDADGDSITYYYKFYNQTDGMIKRNWSTTNTYVIQRVDAYDTIVVYAKAYDGAAYSGEKSTSKTVSAAWQEVETWTDEMEASLPTGQPTLISPGNGGTIYDNTPTFNWIAGADADSHRFLLDDDSDFSSTVENILLGGTATTYTYTTPLADDNYWWKVIAKGGESENSSDVWTFELLTPVVKEWCDVETWVNNLDAEFPLPIVTTQPVTDITQTTATGHGTITDDGGDPGATRGMCWATHTTPTTADSHATNGTGEGAYTVPMTGLSADTHYYVRAYSINSAGTGYGEQVEFDTLPIPKEWHEVETWIDYMLLCDWRVVETWTDYTRTPEWFDVETWTDHMGVEMPPKGWQEVETWTDYMGGEMKEFQEVETWTTSINSVVGMNHPPTTPTSIEITPTPAYVGSELTATASGSTDVDEDPITYYYQFYNVTDDVLLWDWSTVNIYMVAPTDNADTIRVSAKAYDGQLYSESMFKDKTISSYPKPPVSGWAAWAMFMLRITFIAAPLCIVGWKINKVDDPITGTMAAAHVIVCFMALILLWFIADAIEMVVCAL